MKAYYLSRALLSIVLGILFYLASHSVLVALLVTAALVVIFLYLPRSGRYAVLPQNGITALQRDEWTQTVNQRSGRNAWVVVMLACAALVLYFGLLSPGDVPVGWLGALLLSGAITYYVSDFWLRRQ